MDIIPFYYENGQLEAISSAHQWLKQSELSGTNCSIWSSGLNEAISRERFARNSTLAANGTASSNLALTNLAMGVPTGIIMPSHFLQQQQQPQRQQQIKNSLNSQLFNKINRRRKAAIIARCAVAYPCGVSGGEELLPSATSAAIANVASSGGAFSGTSKLDKPTNGRTSTAITVESASPNPREGTTDGSDSDEHSDVEVLELDEADLGSDDLFGLEERQHNDADPKMAQWRKSFEKAITERYRNKCRRRNMLCRRMLEFNLQRLKATESIELNQLLLTDLQIREKYAISTAPASDQLLLVHRETGRVFICLEDMFDVLSKFHTEHGHGGSRKAMYVEARKRFANVSKEIVREFLDGCDLCAMSREGNGWGGRRVKGTGRSVARTARTTPARTTEIVGGLALRQYLEGMKEQNQQQQLKRHQQKNNKPPNDDIF
uniref:Integrase zinc-binding domain-containing protein n=1 Tax=Globodera rostochiensis TaxID=31243 RepID=A0A914HZF0_GLORO